MNGMELVSALKDGSKDAFASIYKMYYGKVYNFSCLYLTSRQEVEDVVQEVFVKLWDVRSFLRVEEPLLNFLFIVTRNLIFNQFRKSFNENAYKLTVVNGAADSYDISEDLDTEDLRCYIHRLIEELPPRQQEVFRLSREEHLSYKEIAERLDISEKTVERHINESLKFIRRNLHLFSIFLAV